MEAATISRLDGQMERASAVAMTLAGHAMRSPGEIILKKLLTRSRPI
jgi:hypothetical protein